MLFSVLSICVTPRASLSAFRCSSLSVERSMFVELVGALWFGLEFAPHNSLPVSMVTVTNIMY